MKSSLLSLRFLILGLIILFNSCKKEERIKIPIVETLSVLNIINTSASSGGKITDDVGGRAVITRGVCWSTSNNPTIYHNKTIDGAGAGSFLSKITGLSGVTIYYVKAYATNSSGTGYGMAISFSTSGLVPTSTTQAATNVLPSSATLNGIVNPNSLSTIVTFEYGINTSYGQVATAKQSPLIGSINQNVSTNITGLIAATTYHFRTKTENALGITYGRDMPFKTTGMAPTTTTQAATNVLPYSATLNASVNANYFTSTVIFEYGVSTSYGSTITATQSPVTGSSSVNLSAGITGLSLTTTYHFRVKAENVLGITYGSDMSFKTAGQVPTSATQAATKVSPNSATLNGTVNANYFSTAITFEYGISTSYGFTINATQSPLTGGSSVNVSASITGLLLATTYHFRIKAENAFGVTYGIDMSFKTLITPLSDIDGNNYNTVKIGNQEWMAENLKTTKYNDGTAIPLVTVVASWAALTTPGYCWYNNDEATNKGTYGALYNWYTVNTGKLCPTGWHVPTDNEWTILTTFLGGESAAGGKLKETGTTHWLSPNTGATNESGFTALPGGYLQNNGTFNYIGSYSYWWSSTAWYTGLAWFRTIVNNNSNVYRSNSNVGYGFSVRCVKDF